MHNKIEKHLERPITRLLYYAFGIAILGAFNWFSITDDVKDNTENLKKHEVDKTHMTLEEKQDFTLTKARSERNETTIEKLQTEMKNEIKGVRDDIKDRFEDLKDFIIQNSHGGG